MMSRRTLFLSSVCATYQSAQRRHPQEVLGLIRSAETHHPLHARMVVPAAVEEDQLAGCGEMLQVTLDVQLGLLAFSGNGKCRDSEDPGAHLRGGALVVPPLPAVSRHANTRQPGVR